MNHSRKRKPYSKGEKQSSKSSVANQKLKKSDYSYTSLPNDVALKIASSLEVLDLCSLGCCSQVWRELCRSDCLWEPFVKERWPYFFRDLLRPKFKYIRQHEAVRDQTTSVVKFVEQCSLSGSLELSDYVKAMERLRSMLFGFKDVQMLLFRPKLNVLLNPVGLNYCLNIIHVPASQVVEALQSSKISDRQVCVKWWNRGIRFYGFIMQDECHSRCVSLEDLATAKDKEVRRVLSHKELRGFLFQEAILEDLRVQISFANSTSNIWSGESSQ